MNYRTNEPCYHAVRTLGRQRWQGVLKACCYFNHPSYVTEATDMQLTLLKLLSAAHLLAGLHWEQTALCCVLSVFLMSELIRHRRDNLYELKKSPRLSFTGWPMSLKATPNRLVIVIEEINLLSGLKLNIWRWEGGFGYLRTADIVACEMHQLMVNTAMQQQSDVRSTVFKDQRKQR